MQQADGRFRTNAKKQLSTQPGKETQEVFTRGCCGCWNFTWIQGMTEQAERWEILWGLISKQKPPLAQEVPETQTARVWEGNVERFQSAARKLSKVKFRSDLVLLYLCTITENLKKKKNCKDPIFKYFRVWRSPTSKTWLVGPTTCPSGVSLATGG